MSVFLNFKLCFLSDLKQRFLSLSKIRLSRSLLDLNLFYSELASWYTGYTGNVYKVIWMLVFKQKTSRTKTLLKPAQLSELFLLKWNGLVLVLMQSSVSLDLSTPWQTSKWHGTLYPAGGCFAYNFLHAFWKHFPLFLQCSHPSSKWSCC